MKGFRCPACDYVGKAKDWNKATALVFGNIHPLPKCGIRYIFICPECKDGITKGRLIEVEHSTKGR